jgi:hypothetical protein
VACVDTIPIAEADFAVIPAVTPHLCIRELLDRSSLPVLNLFDPLVKELSSHSIKRVGVFGTRFVIESALFGMADNAEVVQPTQDEVEYIHRTYLELAQTGEGSEAHYRGLTDPKMRGHLPEPVYRPFAGTWSGLHDSMSALDCSQKLRFVVAESNATDPKTGRPWIALRAPRKNALKRLRFKGLAARCYVTFPGELES